MYGYTQNNGYNFNSTYTTTPATAAALAAYGGATNVAAAQQAFGYNTNALGVTGLDASAAANSATAAAAANYYAAYGYGTGGATATPYSTGSLTSTGTNYGFTNTYPAAAQTHKPTYGGAPGAPKSTLTSSKTTSGYSYDAAVYAAASNILSQKAGGTFPNKSGGGGRKNPFSMPSGGGSSGGGGYNGGSGGGGGGGGYKGNNPGGKRYGLGASSHFHREPHQFYCEVCKISCAGQMTYKEHLEGKNHKKKEQLAKGEGAVSLPRSKVSFRCDLCNVTCTGKDTYEAHVRGSKHQRTVALCKKLGKPIPSNEPTIIAPKELGGTTVQASAKTTPVKAAAAVANKKIPTMHFVGGSKLSTTAPQQELAAKKVAVAAAVSSAGKPADAENKIDEEKQKQELERLLAAESKVKPVGEEFVETERDAQGKHLTYVCKLCDCKFSDINAKDIHLKGRRHRLQYKQKVDATLEVEMKPNLLKERRAAKLKEQQAMRKGVRTGRIPYGMPGGPMFGGFGGPMGGPPAMMGGRFGHMGPRYPMDGPRYVENEDDRHIMAKHAAIFPDEAEIVSLESIVQGVEKALKGVSDDIESSKPKTEGEVPERTLKGAMRIGILSKGLVLKAEKEVELVALLSEIPTTTFLNTVKTKMPQHIEEKDYTVVVGEDQASLVYTVTDKLPQVRIFFTSTIVRNAGTESTTDGGPSGDITAAATTTKAPEKPSDMLAESVCLRALAELRHAKWFQVRCTTLQSCQVTLRILRDIRARIGAWEKLSPWMTELLVEKVICSIGMPIPVGEALRRFFEAIASGILFSSGSGLADPCEKEPTDVLDGLSRQSREDMTSSGQHALRLIAFGQRHKVLGMEPLDPLPRPQPASTDRKRPRDGANGNDDAKKDKIEEGKEGEEAAAAAAVAPAPADQATPEEASSAPAATVKAESAE